MAKEDKAKSPKSKKTKEKEVKAKEVEVEAVPYEVRMKAVTVISKPMADEKKVCGCVYRLVGSRHISRLTGDFDMSDWPSRSLSTPPLFSPREAQQHQVK